MKPNGLFSLTKKDTVKIEPTDYSSIDNVHWGIPNGLFGAYKRSLKPNGLFSLAKRVMKPNGLFSVSKKDASLEEVLYDDEDYEDTIDEDEEDFEMDEDIQETQKRDAGNFWATRGKKSGGDFWAVRG